MIKLKTNASLVTSGPPIIRPFLKHPVPACPAALWELAHLNATPPVAIAGLLPGRVKDRVTRRCRTAPSSTDRQIDVEHCPGRYATGFTHSDAHLQA
jgi:hypothetical protein